MSEQQDIVSPTESASNVSRRKSRPGKAQRTAARSAVTSQASAETGQTSLSFANQFARKMSFTPTPQPGKYPIVFPSGAGEPTRDSTFAIDGESLASSFANVPQSYVDSTRFAEFSADAGYENTTFYKDVVKVAILATAQQVVHAHQNLGLAAGDYSPLVSTDVYIMSAVKAIVRQFGEFSVENLGTRFLLHSYEDEVRALVRTARRVGNQKTPASVVTVLREHWLPSVKGDSRTVFIIASRLKEYFAGFGVFPGVENLCSSLFQQASPAYLAAKSVLPEADRGVFDVLFQPYQSKQDFASKFVGDPGTAILERLRLTWINPAPTSLAWDVSPKSEFPTLVESWIRKKTTITKFFACASGLAERTVASGSPAQLSEVSAFNGVTIVKTLVALSAPECSLLACFSPTAVYPHGGPMNVVLTTSLPISVRAIEFMQRDWL